MICYTHKKFKTSIKPWISTEKMHRIIKFNQKSLVKTIYLYEQRLKKKNKK